eukprot:2058280-Alexandrium_andersonii.AAC.1
MSRSWHFPLPVTVTLERGICRQLGMLSFYSGRCCLRARHLVRPLRSAAAFGPACLQDILRRTHLLLAVPQGHHL